MFHWKKKCIVIEVLHFIFKTYIIKTIEHTCKFMTTKQIKVYHTIINQII